MRHDSRPSGPDEDCEVMGAVDTDRFVIADLCRDGAWLAVPVDAAADLGEYA